MKLDKIYLLNHKDFDVRRNNIESKLKSEKIEYELVQNYHPSEINYEYDLGDWNQHFDIEVTHPYGNYKNFSKKVSIGSLSLVLKHKFCFLSQLKYNYKNILILEDDCEIPNNFQNLLDDVMKEFEPLTNFGVGVVMLGTAFNFSSKKNDGTKKIYFDELQKTRCTHAYIINIEVTKKIIEYFSYCNLPIDFKLNELFEFFKIKVAWLEPGLIQVKF
jgi:GR25 family glycosyltransferase involved in LPS biosynthesis